ncbi:M23 family metallopeptidase [Tessaracoccus lacteus]|uniref:M23 family metallopeptidase n=1 Tax=Tessaracoccus lacteus TaxID=3041766 RepID=A0ABY8PVN3_9ACTN|nr:M23 family metallopeptidase [Tessaracoccus sp. T21]WGT46521.1 M23 family metallopeptidase [Tessaracoccus sp. T21]
MNDNASRSARRAAVDIDDIVEVEATGSPARRGATALRFSRRLISLSVAGALSVSALFAFAFVARGAGFDAADDVAVPAAAASAAEEAFGDRSEEVSRSVVRSHLSDAIADDAAKERESALAESNESAAEAETETTAAERESLMSADLVLVAKQSKKLKAEAEAAQKLLETAAAAAVGLSINDLSAQDIENLTTEGGSMPVKSNYRIGASFGATGTWARYHTGQDFPAPVGTPIYAAASGVVLSSTAGSWAGTNVVIQHSSGATLYAHMSRKVVSPGDTVKVGQLIGYVGVTGRSFGAHLHFEYYPDGTTPGDIYSASNPVTWLKSLGVSVR